MGGWNVFWQFLRSGEKIMAYCSRISNNLYTLLIRTPPFPAKDANFVL